MTAIGSYAGVDTGAYSTFKPGVKLPSDGSTVAGVIAKAGRFCIVQTGRLPGDWHPAQETIH